jgi:hypothetical protein
MWQPDGWARTRIGVLTPHADVGPEAEFGAMASDEISIHAARVPLGAYRAGGAMDRTIADDPVRAFADPPLVDDAAELLASAPLHAIAYCFTSSSYVRGGADDAKLKERLETRTRGIPVVIPCAAAVTALIALGAKRLALINPPWFSAEIRLFQLRRQSYRDLFLGVASICRANQIGRVQPGFRKLASLLENNSLPAVRRGDATREICREFCGIRPFAAIFVVIRRANSNGYSQIPCATEQGISAAITGNFLQRTGNFALENWKTGHSVWDE